SRVKVDAAHDLARGFDDVGRRVPFVLALEVAVATRVEPLEQSSNGRLLAVLRGVLNVVANVRLLGCLNHLACIPTLLLCTRKARKTRIDTGFFLNAHLVGLPAGTSRTRSPNIHVASRYTSATSLHSSTLLFMSL